MSHIPSSGLINHSLAPDRRLPGGRGRLGIYDAKPVELEFPPHLTAEHELSKK